MTILCIDNILLAVLPSFVLYHNSLMWRVRSNRNSSDNEQGTHDDNNEIARDIRRKVKGSTAEALPIGQQP